MKIAILGASRDRGKYGNKAVRAYKDHGDTVFPVNPNASEIEGLKCYKTVLEIKEKVDIASSYLPADICLKLVGELAKKGIRKIYLNPGAESDTLIKALKKRGIQPLMQCSILAIGKEPGDY